MELRARAELGFSFAANSLVDPRWVVGLESGKPVCVIPAFSAMADLALWRSTAKGAPIHWISKKTPATGASTAASKFLEGRAQFPFPGPFSLLSQLGSMRLIEADLGQKKGLASSRAFLIVPWQYCRSSIVPIGGSSNEDDCACCCRIVNRARLNKRAGFCGPRHAPPKRNT